LKDTSWLEAQRKFSERAGEPGVSPLDELRKRSGLEFLRAIAAGELPSPPIGRALNFFLHEVEPGRVVFQGEPKLEFYNPIGSIHGGWASTLLDSCMACAVQTSLKAGQAYTTLELKINLVRALAADTGPVRAEGRIVHAGRQVATADGRLYGPDGKLYAHGSTTCLVFAL
jgi:uncharacterized protein (TIGR00369 family)